MGKQKVNHVLAAMVLLVLALGCTVTKRHFGPGYHVEWKKNYSSEKKVDKNQNIETPVQERLASTEITQKKVDAVQETFTIEQPSEKINTTKSDFNEKSQLEKQSISSSSIIDSDNKAEIEEIKIDTRNSVSIDEKQSEDVTDTPKRTDPYTWVSLSLFIATGLYGIFFLIAFQYLFNLSITFLGFTGILFGLAIAFLIFSIISFIRINRNPEKYKNKALTRILFALSLALFTVALLVFFLGLYTDSGPTF